VKGGRAEWKQIRFSPDGRDLLINAGSSDKAIHLINSFDGTLTSSIRHDSKLGQACFSPDGAYVLAGADDKKVHAWRRADGRHLAGFEGHSARPNCVRFNPTKLMFASSCSNLVSLSSSLKDGCTDVW
jgi:COMPASS component SWD2